MGQPIMNHRHISADGTGELPRPTEYVGAGPLTSAVWKLGSEQSGWSYRFNVVRQTSDSGHCSDLFQPADLIHFVKLIQVLAAVIADDGCLTQADTTTLRTLAAKLDDIFGDATVESDKDTVATT
jgi:hypothetical protein